MSTLKDCLQKATSYWSSKGPSSRMMPIRAAVGVSELGEHLEATHLGPEHGTLLLTSLQARRLRGGTSRPLKPNTVIAYYAAFRRMLALNGVETLKWPTPGAAPRRVREPMAYDAVWSLHAWLQERYPETGWLLYLLVGTGMRVEVEALTPGATLYDPQSNTLKVTGKGGHERVIPVAETQEVTRAIRDARRVPYTTHLSRWNKGVKALGISSRLPTPHAVRHLYATRAYARCKDLMVVKELLGHADINTTARYVGVDMEALRSAVA